jgi:hypothetical protein
VPSQLKDPCCTAPVLLLRLSSLCYPAGLVSSPTPSAALPSPVFFTALPHPSCYPACFILSPTPSAALPCLAAIAHASAPAALLSSLCWPRPLPAAPFCLSCPAPNPTPSFAALSHPFCCPALRCPALPSLTLSDTLPCPAVPPSCCFPALLSPHSSLTPLLPCPALPLLHPAAHYTLHMQATMPLMITSPL